MLNKAAAIERESPKSIKLFGSRQIPGLVTSGEFYQISLTTGHSRSENPGGGALAVCSSVDSGSGNLGEGRGESMLYSAVDFGRNFQAACEKIEQRGEGLNILHALSSEYDVNRKHDLMTRQNLPKEEKYSSKRRRFSAEQGENLRPDEGENVAAADQSDSTLKGSDLTAERMAEGSSRTTSSSEINGKLDPPPMAATNLSSTLKEKLKGTCSDSGILHENIRSSIDEGQTLHRSEGFSSSSRPVSGQDEDWLALGLDCGYGIREPKHLSNKLSLDVTNNVKGSIIRWNTDKDTEEQRQQQMHMLNSGHTSSKLATLLPPSFPIQPAQQFSFHNARADITNYSNARPLLQGAAMANRFSFQKNITDSSNFSALNLLQPCTMEDQQNSQNAAVFPSVEQNFLYQRHTAGTSKVGPAAWQGFYDRISEARIPSSTDLYFSEPRIGSYKGGHRFSQGWRGSIAGTSDAYRNSETESLASLAEAGVLQKEMLEKMQYRTQWNTRDNLSPWYKPGTSLGSLIRPNASEIASRRFSTDDRTLPFRQQQHQQYERQALPQERNSAGPARDLQRFPGASWTENVRIFKPSRVAQTGVWFMLQALNNQSVYNDRDGDRMLPQIPRNYLRIKDGTTTILVVKKYLVNKLGLNSESEIEIMCKGQKLVPSLTLQHVRDVMWSSAFNDGDISRIVASSNPSSTEHLMVLHYQRNNAAPQF